MMLHIAIMPFHYILLYCCLLCYLELLYFIAGQEQQVGVGHTYWLLHEDFLSICCCYADRQG